MCLESFSKVVKDRKNSWHAKKVEIYHQASVFQCQFLYPFPCITCTHQVHSQKLCTRSLQMFKCTSIETSFLDLMKQKKNEMCYLISTEYLCNHKTTILTILRYMIINGGAGSNWLWLTGVHSSFLSLTDQSNVAICSYTDKRSS